MESARTGKPVANQFVISLYDAEGMLHEYFQSYDSVIVANHYGKAPYTELDERFWDYSRTTSKYRNKFLREDTKEIKAKIKSGEYKLTNLN